MMTDLVGTGWSFPTGTDATGGILLVSRDRDIERSIRLILGTAYGERPMRPEFGCAIHELTFTPVDATTAGQISYEVRSSLARWEPRIDVTRVDVSFERDDPSTIYIDVAYTIRATNDARNLVFPFYSIPGELESGAAFLSADTEGR